MLLFILTMMLRGIRQSRSTSHHWHERNEYYFFAAGRTLDPTHSSTWPRQQESRVGTLIRRTRRLVTSPTHTTSTRSLMSSRRANTRRYLQAQSAAHSQSCITFPDPAARHLRRPPARSDTAARTWRQPHANASARKY